MWPSLKVGCRDPRRAVAATDKKSGRWHIIKRRPGDGTVTRVSAVTDERIGDAWQPGPRSPVG